MTCCQTISIDRRREQAAACMSCEWSGPNSGPTATTCDFDGQSIALHVNGYPCPIARAPGKDGMSKDFGMRWIGLSFPRRLYLWLVHPKHPRPSRFVGCGCLAWLKSFVSGGKHTEK